MNRHFIEQLVCILQEHIRSGFSSTSVNPKQVQINKDTIHEGKALYPLKQSYPSLEGCASFFLSTANPRQSSEPLRSRRANH
ncbi:hypothetical protein HPP92_023747 [Vanilla planifolia]|uniref:Uncharacterized protein n=1 Tax=Vanilla planifolia TaxID=51239 RepID=A0A835PMB4_VANPL|nr:hypothetical protein HPP92_023747 [Vanilla planifolia]